MNELQQVLLIFAVVVIIGLYFLSRSRQAALKKEHEKQKEATSNTSYQKAGQALNDLGEPHIPVSKSTEARITKQDEIEGAPEVNEKQANLPFGEEFNASEQAVPKSVKSPVETPVDHTESTQEAEPELQEELAADNRRQDDVEPVGQNGFGGKHHILVVDDAGMTKEGYQYTAPEYDKPSFGVPEEERLPQIEYDTEKKEPQVFVILVMSTGQEFSMIDVNQALLGVGLSFVESQIYVKQDNMGHEIIKVANLMEPGTFPTEEMQNYTTCGVAMILELPTTVKAPAAMYDLIMMARKISQRLQGRLYNMDRQLLKESDLQMMRDAAVKYESEPL